MAETTDTPPKSGLIRRLPLIAILIVAAVGAFTLRDVISFETLAQNRERLIAFRDAHYAGTVAAFMAAYVAIVAFSLPGATIATLTGGFLFGVFPGALFNVTAATIGATLIFLAARWGLGERLAARMDQGEGRIQRIKRGIDENQWEMLFLIRLVPAVPFFVANLLPALVGVPLVPLRGQHLLRDHPRRGRLHLGRRGAGRGLRAGRGAGPRDHFRAAGASPHPRACGAGRAAHRGEGPARAEGALSMAEAVARRIKTDVCVIGAGSGGLSVAAGAVQMGARVVLIEAHLMGGDCLNFGCVPSKALLAAGKQAQAHADGAKFGVAPVEPEVDYAAAKDHVRRVIETIAPGRQSGAVRGAGGRGDPRLRALHLEDRGAGGRYGDRGAALRDRHGLAPLRAADPGHLRRCPTSRTRRSSTCGRSRRTSSSSAAGPSGWRWRRRTGGLAARSR